MYAQVPTNFQNNRIIFREDMTRPPGKHKSNLFRYVVPIHLKGEVEFGQMVTVTHVTHGWKALGILSTNMYFLFSSKIYTGVKKSNSAKSPIRQSPITLLCTNRLR